MVKKENTTSLEVLISLSSCHTACYKSHSNTLVALNLIGHKRRDKDNRRITG